MIIKSFEDWKNKLLQTSLNPKTVILVEGKRDKYNLRKIGIKNVIPLQGKKFYDILEIVEDCNEVILLFDLDKQGEKIFLKFYKILRREGIPVNIEFREYLKNFGVKEIENLPILENNNLINREEMNAC
ncbi:toprim domain-containing protein [Persephonella sp.]